MNRKYVILLFIVILLSSCEKSQDKNDILLKLYGDASEDIGYSITKVSDGYIITGQLTEVARIGGNIIDDGKSVKKMGIIKTGTDGNVIWKKYFGDGLTAVGSKVLALDGSIVCTGYVVDSVTLEKDIFTVKLDTDGNGSLEKIYKSAGNQYGTDILKTQEGFLILGTTDVKREPLTDSTGNPAGKNDILLLRLNNNLEPVMSPVAFGFPGNDEGAAFKSDINGGCIIIGTTERSIPKTDQAGKNILLLRVNADGSAIQPRILGGLNDEYASDIEVVDDGYLAVATVGGEGLNQHGYVWKISNDIYASPASAHEIKIVISSSNQISFSIKAICKYKTNSFIMAGQAGSGSSAKMLIFETDGDGNLLEDKKMIAGGTGIQIAYDVITDESDNIIVVGKNSYEKNSMISLFKFRF